ncbi:MAG: hypothetical protein M3Y27_22640, partial [Acidobacteriota bacterium]|nr:hypothetical protein [Acidobacteriota bacterium]
FLLQGMTSDRDDMLHQMDDLSAHYQAAIASHKNELAAQSRELETAKTELASVQQELTNNKQELETQAAELSGTIARLNADIAHNTALGEAYSGLEQRFIAQNDVLVAKMLEDINDFQVSIVEIQKSLFWKMKLLLVALGLWMRSIEAKFSVRFRGRDKVRAFKHKGVV